MKLLRVLQSSVLLASAVFAAPESQGRPRSPRSRPSESVKADHSQRAENKRDTISFIPPSNDAWAGSILSQPAPTAFFGEVQTQFTIPAISAPGNANPYSTAVWVGIDGSQHQSGVFQAGVTLATSASSGSVYTAWYQWYPSARVNLPMAISLNDEISILLSTSSSTSGSVVFNNLTKKLASTTPVTAPVGSSVLGLSAEFIMEYEISGGFSLPAFSSFEFTQCQATAGGSMTVDVENSAIVEIEDSSGAILTSTTIPDGNTVEIMYLTSG